MPVPAYEAPRATPIYSFAALKTKQREIKDRAAEEVVHITAMLLTSFAPRMF